MSKAGKGKKTAGKMKQYQLYEPDYTTGKLKRTLTFCPRCQGVFLANHKDRKACGSCGYTEYVKTAKKTK
jgi:small subunit ribosomal protein S27Ae